MCHIPYKIGLFLDGESRAYIIWRVGYEGIVGVKKKDFLGSKWRVRFEKTLGPSFYLYFPNSPPSFSVHMYFKLLNSVFLTKTLYMKVTLKNHINLF